MPFYLVYTSLPRTAMSRTVLDDITSKSVINNSKENITGILLGIESRYLQYLEGEESKVLDLFNKIKNDPRHYEVNKWIQGYTDERVFKDWSMASWMLTNEELQNLNVLKEINEFLQNPKREKYPSGKFLEMIQNLMESWIAHEAQRSDRLNHE